jgi:hypothetical protein
MDINVGAQCIFTEEEELGIIYFVRCTLQLSEYGFPITQLDLRHIVGAYLQMIGRNEPRFKLGYLPGIDWAKSFVKRHPELSVRFVANIKKARATVTKETLEEFNIGIDFYISAISNVPFYFSLFRCRFFFSQCVCICVSVNFHYTLHRGT